MKRTLPYAALVLSFLVQGCGMRHDCVSVIYSDSQVAPSIPESPFRMTSLNPLLTVPLSVPEGAYETLEDQVNYGVRPQGLPTQGLINHFDYSLSGTSHSVPELQLTWEIAASPFSFSRRALLIQVDTLQDLEAPRIEIRFDSGSVARHRVFGYEYEQQLQVEPLLASTTAGSQFVQLFEFESNPIALTPGMTVGTLEITAIQSGIRTTVFSTPVTDSGLAFDFASKDYRFALGVAYSSLSLLYGSQSFPSEAQLLTENQGSDPSGRRQSFIDLMARAMLLETSDGANYYGGGCY